MNVQSNIEMYYKELVDDMRKRHKLVLEDDPDIDQYEADDRVLDDVLIYSTDHAYILAHALMKGIIVWGEPVDWQDIYDMLIEDMNSNE